MSAIFLPTRNTAANSGTSVSPCRDMSCPLILMLTSFLMVTSTGSSVYASGTADSRGSNPESSSLVRGVTRSPLFPWTDPGSLMSLLMSAVTGSSTSPARRFATSSVMTFTRMSCTGFDRRAIVSLSNIALRFIDTSSLPLARVWLSLPLMLGYSFLNSFGSMVQRSSHTFSSAFLIRLLHPPQSLGGSSRSLETLEYVPAEVSMWEVAALW